MHRECVSSQWLNRFRRWIMQKQTDSSYKCLFSNHYWSARVGTAGHLCLLSSSGFSRRHHLVPLYCFTPLCLFLCLLTLTDSALSSPLAVLFNSTCSEPNVAHKVRQLFMISAVRTRRRPSNILWIRTTRLRFGTRSFRHSTLITRPSRSHMHFVTSSLDLLVF